MSIVRASSEGVESTGNPVGKYVSQSGVLAGTTPITDVPDQPTIGTATDVGTGRAFNNGAATVTATPAATGGVPATYTMTSSPGGFTGTGTSPVTVTGLQSGISYTFTAVANATAGSSPVTASASNSITATTVPGSPTVTGATNGIGRPYNNGSATVTFTAPGNNGGKAITGYTISSSGPTVTSVAAGSSPVTLTGLLPGSYTFAATATNANGTSSSSGAGGSINISTVPQVPTINSVTATNSTTVTLSYIAGGNGGSAITAYTVVSSPFISLSYNSSNPTTLTGTFAEGQEYTFTMTATNANGTSTTSNTSNAVIPKAAPGNQTFLASGTFTVPSGVTSISAVAIGGGQSGSIGGTPDGGNGGNLRWATISTTPGESLTVTVGSGGIAASTTRLNGGNSSISRGATNLLLARGGGQTTQEVGTGYIGGVGQVQGSSTSSGGAGGAAGYAGNGGSGGSSNLPVSNSGAAAGSALSVQSTSPTYGEVFPSASGRGGGVGPWGLGITAVNASDYGSGGFRLTSDTNTRLFGSGGGSQQSTPAISRNNGTDGVVRIIWGDGRSYPSTNVTFTPTLVGYVSGTNIGTAAISYPSGTTQGDLLVFIQSDGNGTAAPAVPTNWTAPRAMRSTAPSCATFWKIAGTETSVSPVTSIGNSGNYMIAAFRNIHLDGRSGNVDVQGGKNVRGADQYGSSNPSSGLPAIPATTIARVQVPNAISIVTAAIDDIAVSGPGAPSGWTFVGYQQSVATTGGASMMAYKIHSTDSDTSAATTFSGSGSDTSSSVIWTFRPGEYTTT